MAEPRWRIILCWGTVVTFLSLPLLVFTIAVKFPLLIDQIREFKFLSDFFKAITALVFGLAGLDSFDKRSK